MACRGLGPTVRYQLRAGGGSAVESDLRIAIGAGGSRRVAVGRVAVGRVAVRRVAVRRVAVVPV